MPTSEGGYKQFKIGDIFEKIDTKSLKYKVKDLPVKPEGKFTLPALTAGIINQGLSCFVPRTDATILKNVISVSANGANTGAMFFQPDNFTVLQDSYAIKLRDGDLNEYSAFYFIAAMEKVIRKYYDWSNKAGWNKIKGLSISVPVDKDSNVDMNFIESLVFDFRRERIDALNDCLQTSGYSDCSLTEIERNAIDNLERRINNGSHIKLSQLFEIKGTKSLDEGNLEFIKEGINFVGRVNENNGVKGFIAMQDFEPNEPNTITATVIGNYKYVKFQEKPYYCSQNINKLTPLFEINNNVALFFVAHILKFTSTYNGQQGGYKLPDLQNHIISLPVTSDGSIDYEFMENYINAIKKQTIARVKEYIEQEHSIVEEEPQIEQTIIPLVYPEYKPGRIPLYTLRAACGYFGEGRLPEEEGWVDATGLGFTPDPKRHFAVHAKGDSMLPKIHDGDICIFEWYTGGSRDGEIVLSQISEFDDAYDGRYTIKHYHSTKKYDEYGNWEHASIQLQPLNPDFNPIDINEFEEVPVIGIFKSVLN